MQTDPIGYSDGINWYAYCGNSPFMFFDPLGMRAWYNPKGIPVLLYTGSWHSSDNVYNEARDAAAVFLFDSSPVRGGSVSIGKTFKTKTRGRNIGIEAQGSWTMDKGFGASVQGGISFKQGKVGKDGNKYSHQRMIMDPNGGGKKKWTADYLNASINVGYNQEDGLNGGWGLGRTVTQKNRGVSLGGNRQTFDLGINVGVASAGLTVDASEFGNLGSAWNDMLGNPVGNIKKWWNGK